MIGMIHQSQKRNAEAKKSYESALEASPNAAVAANNLAWILADERQDLDRALMLANQASALRPEDPQVFDTLGWVYMQNGCRRSRSRPSRRRSRRNRATLNSNTTWAWRTPPPVKKPRRGPTCRRRSRSAAPSRARPKRAACSPGSVANPSSRPDGFVPVRPLPVPLSHNSRSSPVTPTRHSSPRRS